MPGPSTRHKSLADFAAPAPESLRQALLFALVGLVNTAVDFAAFAILLWAGLTPLVANAISFSLGAVNSLILNKSLTFRNVGARYSLRLVVGFLGVTAVSLAAAQASLSTLMALSWSPLLAKLASVFVTFVVGFGLNKFVTFRKSSQHG